ncbi:MAG: mechanosensitive ion channel family protein [Calditrichaceae bacterium]
MFFERLKIFNTAYPVVSDMMVAAGVGVLCFISYLIVARILLRFAERIIRKTKTQLDDVLLESNILKKISYIVPILVVYNLAFLFPKLSGIIVRVSQVLLIWVFVISITAFLSVLNRYYENLPTARERPIKGYIQITNIFIYIIAIIFIIGLLSGQSPWTILGGVGALTAVILLIFRDTILSFVASLQISSYDLVHIGDWIEMPKYGADGDVIDIALHTVKIQNWDKTITVIPTHKLVEDSFKNWRGMMQAGGRRIKRAVHIDLNTIKFCDEEMISRFEEFQLITDYIIKKKQELTEYNKKYHIENERLVNGRRMTNIGTFRAYIEAYIKRHPKINQEMTNMVRQLPPGPTGLPIEIYVFTNDIVWQNYEAIQADIFDHILAVVPQFDLQIYQNPSGRDISGIVIGASK